MTEQQARLAIVTFNLSFNGWGDGSGYPGKCPNPACTYLGRPCEYSCADGYTFACKHSGFPLPAMYAGVSTGFAYVPWGMNYARAHGALRPSWQVEPGDALFINTGSGAQPGHVEMVTAREGDTIFSFGWDSGPSNVDHYTGQGGCHRHQWHAPAGVGNPAIMGTMDLAKVVNLGKSIPTPKPAPHPPVDPARPMLMLKSPWMGTPKGWLVIRQVQRALNTHGAHLLVDGVYGERSDAAVRIFQHHHGLNVDGVVGTRTYHALGM